MAHQLPRMIQTSLLCFGLCISQVFGAVITSGSIQITGLNGSGLGTFTLSGTGFTAMGEFVLGNWGPAFCASPGDSIGGCPAGTLLSVNGTEIGNDFSGGPGNSATIGSVTFPTVAWGDLNALGPSDFSITGLPILLNTGAGNYVSTFSFTGSLCGTVAPYGLADPCAANLPTLTGSGTVVVQIILSGDPVRPLEYVQATYTFSVPEPSTIVPVGLAMALMFFPAIRRRMLKHT